LLPEKQRGCKKLLTGKHHNLYSPPNIIKAINGVWKSEVKRPIERPMTRCEYNIKVGYKEVE
jgi:hypothetical protein